MIQNTLEWKARFVALYFGQSVMTHGGIDYTIPVGMILGPEMWNDIRRHHLELRSIESLTDEELQQFQNIRNVAPSDFFQLPASITMATLRKCTIQDMEKGTTWASVADYLRSIGICIPFMGASVEQLEEWGWVKIVKK